LTYEGGRWRPDATQDSLAQFGSMHLYFT